jgi:hypothetical protein
MESELLNVLRDMFSLHIKLPNTRRFLGVGWQVRLEMRQMRQMHVRWPDYQPQSPRLTGGVVKI